MDNNPFRNRYGRGGVAAVFAVLCLSIIAPRVNAQTIKTCTPTTPCAITWTPNTEPDMQEYRVFLRGASAGYDFDAPAVVIPHPTAQSTTVNLGTLTDGQHFLVLKAVDLAGNLSESSNELTFLYDGPPQAVTITITVP